MRRKLELAASPAKQSKHKHGGHSKHKHKHGGHDRPTTACAAPKSPPQHYTRDSGRGPHLDNLDFLDACNDLASTPGRRPRLHDSSRSPGRSFARELLSPQSPIRRSLAASAAAFATRVRKTLSPARAAAAARAQVAGAEMHEAEAYEARVLHFVEEFGASSPSSPQRPSPNPAVVWRNATYVAKRN